jgi:hypothetical protein
MKVLLILVELFTALLPEAAGLGNFFIFYNGTNSQISFYFYSMTSEHNLNTLIIANWLPLLIESCLAGPKLLGSLALLIFVVLFTFFIMVLTYEFSFYFYFMILERNLSILVKELYLLKVVQRVWNH